MQVPEWQGIATAVAESCRSAGLDLLQPFSVRWYNDVVAVENRLPDCGRKSCLGLLVGNTRVLWRSFLLALRDNPALLNEKDPIDRYVEAAVARAASSINARTQCVWGHGSRQLAVQQLAQRSGMAWLSPGHLSVHPTFGPWIALRAALIVDVDGPETRPAPAIAPCDACSIQCEPAFARAAATLVEPVNQAAVTPHWQRWLAARDACPVGRAFRYDDAQIRYHYTKDKAYIVRGLAELA